MKMPVFDYRYLFDPRVPDHPELLFRKKWVQFPVLFFLVLWIGGYSELKAQDYTDVSFPGYLTHLSLAPSQTDYEIKFFLKGADGGIGSIQSGQSGTCAGSVDGGRGKEVKVSYIVGSDQLIKPGAQLRFITGVAGSTPSIGNECTSLSGSGGGGSAVLVKNPGNSTWEIVTVAGAGGGGHVLWLGTSSGQGGGRGEVSNDNGVGAPGSGPGGGAFTGNASGCQHGGAPGMDQGGNGGAYTCGSSMGGQNGISGGWGFGGGGASYNSRSGGGGGYSGGKGGTGGASSEGGTSYVAAGYKTKDVYGGGSTGSPQNGFVRYMLPEPPTAKCKESVDVFLDSDNGTGTLSVTDVDNGSTAPTGATIVVRSLNRIDFDCGDVLSVPKPEVTLTVRSSNGMSSQCKTTVNVKDNTKPIIQFYDPYLTLYLDENGEAELDPERVTWGSTDNCGFTRSYTKTKFTCDDVGENEITATLTDPSGNYTSEKVIITVRDTISPVVKTKDITVYALEDGHLPFTASDLDDGSFDACGGPLTFSADPIPEDWMCNKSYPSGGMDICVGKCVNITLEVEDQYGNKAKGEAYVKILDTFPPKFEVDDMTLFLDENGKASFDDSDLTFQFIEDNCQGLGLNLVREYLYDCSDLGDNLLPIRERDASGNVGEYIITVTVIDQIAPVAVAKDITVFLDAHGEVRITPSDIDGGSYDNCSGDLSVDRDYFTAADLGANNVTLTVVDPSGNQSTAMAMVTVVDDAPPVVRTKQDVTLYLSPYSNVRIDVETIDNGSSDNDEIVRMWIEGQTEFGCGDIGEHFVWLFAEDRSGNVESVRTQVNIVNYVADFSNVRGLSDGDTLHLATCQKPLDISSQDLDDYINMKTYGKITGTRSLKSLPMDAPWGMYQFWEYSYRYENGCGETETMHFYLAMYDLDPPIVQRFLQDTVIESVSDLPVPEKQIRMVDFCQYVAWDTIVTNPVIDFTTGDTIAFTRRWIAVDPSGHQGFSDQMIWIRKKSQLGRITGQVVSHDGSKSLVRPEASGLDDIPVSLYYIDTVTNESVHVASTRTGDWNGAQGVFLFGPVMSGIYQIKVDTTVCLSDTLQWDENGWSALLTIGENITVDMGKIWLEECVVDEEEEADAEEPDTEDPLVEESEPKESIADDSEPEGIDFSDIIDLGSFPNAEKDLEKDRWFLYPNPSIGTVQIRSGKDLPQEYKIYDALGRFVKSGVFVEGENIDLHNLKAGIYYFRLEGKNAAISVKRLVLVK